AKVGSIQTVLIDELVEDEHGNIEAIGRTKADAPEIDGVVYLADAEGLNPGDFVDVQITDADGHDLWGGPPQE
ncbi:MAG: TRAM domain-containing protein, partial [Methylophilaceae bacterium]|nr:TRAM domain-containing protein [Methylophilaceae bacterium]